MLFPIVVSPKIFIDIPENTRYQRLLFNSLIGLLQKISNNCIILVDDQQEIKKEIVDAINQWPVKFRKPAQKIVKRLQQKNRIIPVNKAYNLCDICNNQYCQHCLGIRLSGLADVIFMTQSCCKFIKEQKLNIKPIDIDEYEISKFASIREQNSTITLTNREWNQDRFEDKILIPIFRHSKHLKIFDRMIGRSTLKKGGIIPEHYRETIEWLLEIFLQQTSGRNARVFEIYCGIDTIYYDSGTINQSKRALQQFCNQLGNTYNFPVEIYLKKEQGFSQEMEHDRYLITDQIGVHIGRGCDLLWTNTQMQNNGLNPNRDPRPVKGVTLSLIPQPDEMKKIVRTVRLLTDL